jgi:hypothetical protein
MQHFLQQCRRPFDYKDKNRITGLRAAGNNGRDRQEGHEYQRNANAGCE